MIAFGLGCAAEIPFCALVKESFGTESDMFRDI